MSIEANQQGQRIYSMYNFYNSRAVALSFIYPSYVYFDHEIHTTEKAVSDGYLRGSQNHLGIIVFILYAIYFQLAPEKRHIGLVISP